jgi:hypothetical protein
MLLALNFLLIILVEIPILILFFKRKKRQNAIYMALLINIISWAVAHVILFSTEVNIYYVTILIIIGEAIAFNKFLECSWKKSFIMSLLVNTLSFLATQYIPLDEMFPSRPEQIMAASLTNIYSL